MKSVQVVKSELVDLLLNSHFEVNKSFKANQIKLYQIIAAA
jgi:hypothetical protein